MIKLKTEQSLVLRPFKVQRFKRGGNQANRSYLALCQNEHAVWAQPMQKLADAKVVAHQMLVGGAHMAIVISLASHQIVFNASRPLEQPRDPAQALH